MKRGRRGAGGGRGAPRGRGGRMKGGSKVVVEPHRYEGIFIAKGKEDALCTNNMPKLFIMRRESLFRCGISFNEPIVLVPSKRFSLAARSLMQNGLRACPTSEGLWIEYIRMELTYLNKLKARKVALGEDEGTLTHDHTGVDEKLWRDENKELFTPFYSNSRDTLPISEEIPGCPNAALAFFHLPDRLECFPTSLHIPAP